MPKYETRYHNGLINWPKSIGYKIEFYYRGIEGEFLITDYYSRREKNRNRFYLKVQYKDNGPVSYTHLKNPGKDLPKAIIGGLSIVMAINVVINLAYLSLIHI